MSKYLYSFAFVAALLLGATSAEASFDTTLSVGSRGSSVIALQEFLINQGYLEAGYATGNFLSMTEKAVKAFQTAKGIEAIGIFGPRTRAAANLALASNTNAAPKASISNVTIQPNTNSASVAFASSKIITWLTNSYPADTRVNINLLKKTSSNPNTYVLIRQIGKEVANTGTYIWTLEKTDVGDLYIEINCSNLVQFKNGCTSSGPVKVN